MQVHLWPLVLFAVLAAACAAPPPVTPGYVTKGRAKAGRVLAGVQGGIATTVPDGNSVAGVAHLEPFFAADHSIPLDAAVHRGVGEQGITRFMSRVGYRGRVSKHRMILGLGIGPNYMKYEPSEEDGQRSDDIRPGLDGFGFELSGEFAYEWRSRYVGLSFTGRPAVTWNEVAFTTLWLLPEVTPAVFITENLGISLSVVLGVGMVFLTERRDLHSDVEGAMGYAFTRQFLLGVVWTEDPDD